MAPTRPVERRTDRRQAGSIRWQQAREAIVLAAAVLSGCGHIAATSALGAKPEPARDPSILVVVHSWTGRTARAGREIARMVGGRLIVVGDPPAPGLAGDGARVAQLQDAIRSGGVSRIYLGFPIWNEAPSAPIEELVRSATLAGVSVVPFYTYLHYVDPASLDRLGESIRARGGVPLAPLPLLVPLSYTDDQVACLARRALLARRDAWPWAREARPAARCAAAGPTTLCSVPAGPVWLGDTSGDCLGEPPRAARVEAFQIQQAEVTIAEYQECSRAGSCPEARLAVGVTAELTTGGDARLPVPGVSFEGATAYCAWRGMRLPTEAEWIRAARADGTDSYPWGPTLEGATACGNFGERPGEGHPHYSVADGHWPSDGFKGLAPACSFPTDRSPFGACDLAGNLSEWVVRTEDPEGKGGEQLLHGGNWLYGDPAALRLSARARIPAGFGGFYLSGFRCARSQP